MRFDITEHAVERYIERFAQGTKPKAARRELTRALVTAQRLRKNTHSGEERWLCDDLGVVAIVKLDRNIHRRVVVTVEPRREEDVGDLPEAAIEYLRRNPGTAELTIEEALALQQAPEPTPAPPPAPAVQDSRIHLEVEKLKLAGIKEQEKTRRMELAHSAEVDALKSALRTAIWGLLANGDETTLEMLPSGYTAPRFLCSGAPKVEGR